MSVKHSSSNFDVKSSSSKLKWEVNLKDMIASASRKEVDQKIKKWKEKWENSVSSVRYSEYNVDLNWD